MRGEAGHEKRKYVFGMWLSSVIETADSLRSHGDTEYQLNEPQGTRGVTEAGGGGGDMRLGVRDEGRAGSCVYFGI